jgi:hypothetical protein
VLSDSVELLSSDETITGNAALERFDLPGLAYVTQDIAISDNPALTALNVGQPLHVGSLAIERNASLPDMSAFEQIRVADGYVTVTDNAALTRASLVELQEVSSFVEVRGNAMLSELAIEALRSANRVTVRTNPKLSNCEVDPMVARVTVTSPSTVCDNAPDACARVCPEEPRP